METVMMMSLIFIALRLKGSLKNPYLLRFLLSNFEIFMPEKMAVELDPFWNSLKKLSKTVVVKTFVQNDENIIDKVHFQLKLTKVA